MEYDKLTWGRIEELCEELARQVRDSGFKPDVLVGVARGGWIPTRIISDILKVYKVASIGVVFYTSVGKTLEKPKLTQELNVDIRGKRVLLVDDVSDSGESLLLAKQKVEALSPSELKTATLHYKPRSKIKPDFFIKETEEWLVYPWERREFDSERK
ncbi:MAG: phosphoribosyltransferase [Candidatus Micrarchaeota archaeon]